MEYTYKNWSNNDIYDFNVEFNRIESYNYYCYYWLNVYYKLIFSLTDYNIEWTINDIVDINDFNRVKSHINLVYTNVHTLINDKSLAMLLQISNASNQSFNTRKANEIEQKLKYNLKGLGNKQFENNISGLTRCGNNLKLNGVI